MESSLSALHAAGVQEISYLVRHTNEPCDDGIQTTIVPYPRFVTHTGIDVRMCDAPYPRFVTHTWIDFSFVCTEEVYDRMKDGGTF